MRFPVTCVSVHAAPLSHDLQNELGFLLREFVVFPNGNAHAGEMYVMKMHKSARP